MARVEYDPIESQRMGGGAPLDIPFDIPFGDAPDRPHQAVTPYVVRWRWFRKNKTTDKKEMK